MSTAIQEYSATDAALTKLNELYRGVVYDVTTSKGMKDAKCARAELRTWRTDLEKERKRLKEWHLEEGRKIDNEARRITKELRDLEDPIDEQIKAEEGRKEAEKKAAEEAAAKAEAERVTAGEKQLQDIKARAFAAVGKSADELRAIIKDVESIETTAYVFAYPAHQVKEEVLEKLESLWADAVKREAEVARVAKERAEVERLRASIPTPAPEHPKEIRCPICPPATASDASKRITAARATLKQFVETYGTIAELDHVVSTIADYLAGVEEHAS